MSDHIAELEDIYDCLAIIENVKKGKEKTLPLGKVMADYGLWKSYLRKRLKNSFANLKTRQQRKFFPICMRKKQGKIIYRRFEKSLAIQGRRLPDTLLHRGWRNSHNCCEDRTQEGSLQLIVLSCSFVLEFLLYPDHS